MTLRDQAESFIRRLAALCPLHRRAQEALRDPWFTPPTCHPTLISPPLSDKIGVLEQSGLFLTGVRATNRLTSFAASASRLSTQSRNDLDGNTMPCSFEPTHPELSLPWTSQEKSRWFSDASSRNVENPIALLKIKLTKNQREQLLEGDYKNVHQWVMRRVMLIHYCPPWSNPSHCISLLTIWQP